MVFVWFHRRTEYIQELSSAMSVARFGRCYQQPVKDKVLSDSLRVCLVCRLPLTAPSSQNLLAFRASPHHSLLSRQPFLPPTPSSLHLKIQRQWIMSRRRYGATPCCHIPCSATDLCPHHLRNSAPAPCHRYLDTLSRFTMPSLRELFLCIMQAFFIPF